ncbi:oligosaccharide flippase family protein [Flavobacterium sp. TSSA_36]|uniref:oligosaccharide flippase family protein n=1 Tax=Flavobacterium sp. TSSA_36 TaxID=3447669 RepID=UPI003F3B6115
MSKYKASIFNYLFNSINAIVMIVNGIIMVPLYFKFMPVSTYGAWLATGNVVGMLGLVESGLSGVITQKMSVALAKKDDRMFFQLAGANLYTALFMSMTLLVLGLSLAPFIADWINADENIKRSITTAYIVSLISAALSLITSLIGAFPQVWQETKTTGIITTVVNIIGVLSLITYLYLGFGVVSLALGYITRAILNLLGQGSWIFIKWRKLNLSKPTYDFDVVKALLKDCFYPFLSRISGVIMGNSQSFILAFFISPTLAAVYDITSKIAFVACNFVSMANGSFFALFSLTYASKNKQEINNLTQKVSLFFLTVLFSALVYSVVFSKSIIYFWVGLDKYGGDLLLASIVISLLITQLKQYFINLLYAGGLINKSAKLDVISMIFYVLLLLVIVKQTQIYAVPIATFISGILFIRLYLSLLKKHLDVDINVILKICYKLFLITAPFVLLHYVVKIDFFQIEVMSIYLALFTLTYVTVLLITNRQFLKQLIIRVKKHNSN